VKDDGHDRADWHPQVRGKKVDMQRLAANWILLHLADENGFIAVLPTEHEEGRVPVSLVKLDELPAIHAHRNRSFDNRAIDDAGHQALAAEPSDLLPDHCTTLRWEFLACHHPYLLVNPNTRSARWVTEQKKSGDPVRPSPETRPLILPQNANAGCCQTPECLTVA
jgi:hypothetical protein